MEVQSNGVESEEFSEAFLCCICLDLLYKPVVLACGHISCFWCVHRSMSSLRESQCPICRHPYHYFPTICQMLHYLLAKIYPVAYRRRETQILEEEKDMNCFSPQFDVLTSMSRMNEEENHQRQPVGENSFDSLTTGFCSTRKGEHFANLEGVETTLQDSSRNVSKQVSSEATCSLVVEEKQLCQENLTGQLRQALIADVLCTACKQLLVRPVVLNCGHVYCQTCIVVQTNEAFRCQACQSPHPSGFPKVCLDLDRFLKEQFPREYELRKGTVMLKDVEFQCENPNTDSREPGKQDVQSWWGDHGSKVHIHVGCDSCGMYPIIGDRYRCKDCVEAIGFDLCGECYNTRSKLPGRFNQQHTPEHRFENVKSNSIRNILLRLVRGQLPDGSPAPISSRSIIESAQNVLSSSTSSNNGEDHGVNGLISIDSDEDQDDGPSPPI